MSGRSLVIWLLVAGVSFSASAQRSRPPALRVVLLDDGAEVVGECTDRYYMCSIDLPPHAAASYLLHIARVDEPAFDRVLRLRGSEIAIRVYRDGGETAIDRIHPPPPGVSLSLVVEDRSEAVCPDPPDMLFTNRTPVAIAGVSHGTLLGGWLDIQLAGGSWEPIAGHQSCTFELPPPLPAGEAVLLGGSYGLGEWRAILPDRHYRFSLFFVVAEAAQFELYATELGSSALAPSLDDLQVTDVFLAEVLLEGSEMIAAQGGGS